MVTAGKTKPTRGTKIDGKSDVAIWSSPREVFHQM
jgi:hypothetical protein